MKRLLQAGPLVAVLALSAASLAQEPGQPLPTELTEEVEVRFVIIDALVHDSKGRIVPDLKLEDFELYLDLFPRELASVDVFCPFGPADDPRPLPPGETREAPVAPEIARRIVLAVDYKNLPQTRRVEVVRNLRAMVRDNPATNEELMVVAITKRLRVEQPFTTDRDKVLLALERIEQDPSLWQEQPIPHEHELELFDALTALIRTLAGYDGSKAIVLFSDLPSKVEDAPFGRPLTATPVALDYDVQYKSLSSGATDARVAIYPIHSRGLTIQSSSKRLARLAVDTGGRFTQYTNDLSLAYVRARRDLACRYAIGFYDDDPGVDRVHRVNIRVRRRGLRVIHPVYYRFGAADVARASLVETSYTAPSVFPSASVRGQIFPIQALSNKRWQTALALSFEVSVLGDDAQIVEFGAKLDDRARRAVHSIDSSVNLQGHDAGHVQPVVVVEPVELAPGGYELSVVVNDPGAGGPQTFVAPIEVPKLPRRGLVVADPILFRPAPEGAIVYWSEDFFEPDLDRPGFQPLLTGEAVTATPLTAVTRLCRLRENGDLHAEVERRIRRDAGDPVVALEPFQLDWSATEEEPCRSVREELPTTELEPGTYRFEIAVREPSLEEPIRRDATFVVKASPAGRPVEPASFELDPDLRVEPVVDGVWRHISYRNMPDYGRVPANGLIVVGQDSAALIDTPWTDGQTARLFEWAEDELRFTIGHVVASPWVSKSKGRPLST